ncbi:MAG TPA: bifunctional phosphoribosylaminoimidazolecarboxamide formyltransferase/inosine monophosphate cyclohydrolase [Candidatus Atribacteria bacterium]|nr:bifunctional phosphoribosylaminoimidazolecarboxamide formyltransferase/inosine monophosphate cyclohydrolase [Candidatus Atribacteria bacterium]
MTKIKRALVSVSDKEGIIDFAKGLEELGIEIISTGGTARLLQEAKIKVKLISEVTGFPEILEGRVKTLHPLIFGGILAKREDPLHQKEIKEQEIEQIDLVVVNLYPFEKTVSQKEVELDEAIENIDIGGPSLLRAAAKNYQDVAVVINPQDYPIILEELEKNQGEISLDTKKRLATEVFEHTSFYDGIINHYLRKNLLKESTSFPQILNLLGKKVSDLRYGENPHQSASFYKEVLVKEANLGDAVQLGGKELSFNNLVDLGAVLEMVKDFQEPTVVFVKHTNPCGLASAETIQEAYQKAYEGDPLSAYGSIIGINRIVDESLANLINETTFVEAILAPDFEDKALNILRQKKNRRLIKVGDLKSRDVQIKDIKKIPGGFLVQDRNIKEITTKDLKVVTNRKPNQEELEELLFAWKVAKQVKSNAIVLTKNKQTIGVGAGQMSRVDSVKIAIMKSKGRSQGSYLASDAFFPFRDGVNEAAKAGITAIIQPGGSKRDEEVIEAANEHNLAMVFTGTRCFKH